MNLSPVDREQVHDLRAAQGQRVGDQHPVAAPPHRLRAHDRLPLAGGLLDQRVDRGPELGRVHVVGVPGERLVVQRGVPGVRTARSAATQRLTLPSVCDGLVAERGGERLATEVRVPARPGEAADVDQYGDGRGLQYRDEVSDRSGAVTDREHLWLPLPHSPILRRRCAVKVRRRGCLAA